jgi:hypothetical protein
LADRSSGQSVGPLADRSGCRPGDLLEDQRVQPAAGWPDHSAMALAKMSPEERSEPGWSGRDRLRSDRSAPDRRARDPWSQDRYGRHSRSRQSARRRRRSRSRRQERAGGLAAGPRGAVNRRAEGA